MAPNNLKHRTRGDPDIDNMNTTTNNKTRKQKRMAMAKRGLRSLAVAVVLPLSLTLANISFYGGSGNSYSTLAKPFWFPNLWALHLICMGTSLLMGLSGWLVWADGGFHRKPMALALYASQLGLTLAWGPIVLGMGAIRVGLMVCLAIIGTLVGCSRIFGEVNSIAGDLVKPCLAWAGFLTIVNLKLLM
ncbi:translocator protein homolog [Cornus florida]|uniref:translocator protein homolog n=1 Tax=Cornus florida TaxID=4283 RepID=UPI00289BE155|nr:translocator protein homolog [Cornus florida]XP_059659536.1 translocator protein homolog [Cornus florida]